MCPWDHLVMPLRQAPVCLLLPESASLFEALLGARRWGRPRAEVLSEARPLSLGPGRPLCGRVPQLLLPREPLRRGCPGWFCNG